MGFVLSDLAGSDLLCVVLFCADDDDEDFVCWFLGFCWFWLFDADDPEEPDDCDLERDFEPELDESESELEPGRGLPDCLRSGNFGTDTNESDLPKFVRTRRFISFLSCSC